MPCAWATNCSDISFGAFWYAWEWRFWKSQKL